MPAPISIPVLAAATSGADSWASFLDSFRRTAAEQIDLLPVVGFVLLVIVIVVLDWKVAKLLSRRAPKKRVAPRADHDEHNRAA